MTTPPRPPLNPLAARSFWYAFVAIALPVANRYFDFDLAGILAVPSGNPALVVDMIWEVVVPALAAAMAWWERRDPTRALVLTGPMT